MLVSKIDLSVACFQTVYKIAVYWRSQRAAKDLRGCHVNATTGHMVEKKITAQISERFVWAVLVKAVKQTVQTIYYVCM